MPVIKYKAWVIQNYLTGDYLVSVIDGNLVWSNHLRIAIRYEYEQYAVTDIERYRILAVPVDISFWW